MTNCIIVVSLCAYVLGWIIEFIIFLSPPLAGCENPTVLDVLIGKSFSPIANELNFFATIFAVLCPPLFFSLAIIRVTIKGIIYFAIATGENAKSIWKELK